MRREIYKTTLVKVLFLTMISIGSIEILQQRQLDYEKSLMMIRDVTELEGEIGDPAYVFDQSVSWFGKNLIKNDEYDKGYTLRVYAIRKFRPRFLVSKIHPNGKVIIGSLIETS